MSTVHPSTVPVWTAQQMTAQIQLDLVGQARCCAFIAAVTAARGLRPLVEVTTGQQWQKRPGPTQLLWEPCTECAAAFVSQLQPMSGIHKAHHAASSAALLLLLQALNKVGSSCSSRAVSLIQLLLLSQVLWPITVHRLHLLLA